MKRTGCWFHDDCLTCLKEECVYEGRLRSQSARVAFRRLVAGEMFAQGRTPKQVMEALKISHRTAERYKALAKEQGMTIS